MRGVLGQSVAARRLPGSRGRSCPNGTFHQGEEGRRKAGKGGGAWRSAAAGRFFGNVPHRVREGYRYLHVATAPRPTPRPAPRRALPRSAIVRQEAGRKFLCDTTIYVGSVLGRDSHFLAAAVTRGENFSGHTLSTLNFSILMDASVFFTALPSCARACR